MIDTDDDRSTKGQILIVDDVPTNLHILENILKEDGYEVAIASHGHRGLELAKELKPDAILLDVMMPGIDGYEVCKAIKESSEIKDIPVLFLTAKNEVESIIKGFQVGAVDYITKPFYPVEILARVNTHLKLRNAQKDIIKLERQTAAFATLVAATHEFSQPLTVLQGNLELFQNGLEPDLLPPKKQKYLAKISGAITKLHNILTKFRDSVSIHFEDYGDGRQITVLDD